MVKKPPAGQETQGTWIQSLGWEDPLEEGMATHSGILAWRIPWTEEPGGLQSVGSQSQTGLKQLSPHIGTQAEKGGTWQGRWSVCLKPSVQKTVILLASHFSSDIKKSSLVLLVDMC